MGCMVSKHSSNLSLKGTTALAFFHKEGIVVAVDSRASNEEDGLEKELDIVDDEVKMHPISLKIISLLVGGRNDCRVLGFHIQKKFPYWDEYAGKEPRVSDVAETIHKYLNGLRGENKRFGILVAGWDAEGHDQIYRLFIRDDVVVKQKVTSSRFGVLGSGHVYAATSLKNENRYNYDMSTDDGTKLALEALFNATVHDRFSGGLLRVFHVDKFGWRPETVQDPLEAYSIYYEHYEEEKTLFLVVSSPSKIPPIPAQKLIRHFWQKGITVTAAHCVAHRVLKEQHCVANGVLEEQRLSFHRLIFNSGVEASNAYALTATHGETDSQLVEKFPNQLLLKTAFQKKLLLKTVEPSVELYLNRSSKDLLEFIRTQFDGYLSTEMTQMTGALGL
ncbi:hypothetical protein ABKV19_020881 [Rosa sericea]